MIMYFKTNSEYPAHKVFNFNGLNNKPTEPYVGGDFVIMDNYVFDSKSKLYENMGEFVYEGYTKIKINKDIEYGGVILEYKNKDYKKIIIALENGNSGDIIRCLIKILS